MSGLADPVEAAIAAADAPTVQLRQVQVTITCSGRPAVVAVPADASDSELLELAGWMLTQLRGALRADEAKTRIIMPGRRI